MHKFEIIFEHPHDHAAAKSSLSQLAQLLRLIVLEQKQYGKICAFSCKDRDPVVYWNKYM